MEIQFLGTGAGVPAKHRNVTGIALKLLDERNAVWLFDCGEGTQLQILKSSIPVSYTHLTLPTNVSMCRSRWSPYH